MPESSCPKVAQNKIYRSKNTYSQSIKKPLKAFAFKGFSYIARGGLELLTQMKKPVRSRFFRHLEPQGCN